MTMGDVELTTDGLVGLDCDPRTYLTTAPTTTTTSSNNNNSSTTSSSTTSSLAAAPSSSAWPVGMDPITSAPAPAPAPSSQHADIKQSLSHLQTSGHGFDHTAAVHDHPHQHHGPQGQGIIAPEWHFQNNLQSHLQYTQPVTSTEPQFSSTYGVPLQPSPIDFIPAAATEAHLDPGLLDGAYMPLSAPPTDMMPFNFQEFHADLTSFSRMDGLPDMSYPSQNLPDTSSPTDTYLEVRSLTSSSSDNGWSVVDNRPFDASSYPDHAGGGVYINPSQTLHNRSLSESSYSDLDQQHPRHSFGGFIDPSHPLSSPTSDCHIDMDFNRRVSCDLASHSSSPPSAVSPVAMVRPMPVPGAKKPTSPSRSPKSQSQGSSGSPPSRKPSRKSPIAAKNSETKVRKQTHSKSDSTSEKRVGKRKGPLNPDQRKQASEIRKLRACLRCKFLKKTCDKGEPCAGCQPSHARLWQVPCTRIDIKDIGYFMKDWKADYERHISLGFSIGNITGFSDVERTLFITHGYGEVLPVNAREVYVRDERCFDLDWVETLSRDPNHFELKTARLSAGIEGISMTKLSDYLDRHIDGNGSFEKFVDDYFEGTPFLTQMLKTAFRYYYRTKLPVVRKALKLILAYNLTMHVTMVEGVGELEDFVGKVEEHSSKYKGKIMAPVMINFQIKCAMASMWREMQKDVLEELSALYSSVYSGDKLKNWPTIFILASILLAVWEEMQFDCHYRVPDPASVDKFCTEMETTPVGVIVGLFQAISQKLPSFSDWDTQKHHHILNSDPDVCHTMTEVRQHVTQYESYLRGRPNSKFDRNDFDCLSNKFVSKLVIRAN